MGAALVCNSPVSLANQLVIDCLRTHLPALHRIGYLSLEVSSDCRKRLHWCKPSGGGLSLEGNLLMRFIRRCAFRNETQLLAVKLSNNQ